jgi:hypothetical protein
LLRKNLEILIAQLAVLKTAKGKALDPQRLLASAKGGQPEGRWFEPRHRQLGWAGRRGV